MRTLRELVATHAGTDRPLTYEALHQRAIDPDTGYQPSANHLWRIATGQTVKINPPLIAAIAAGLGLNLWTVQRAAAAEYLGMALPLDEPHSSPVTDTTEQ
jgi:hypothetical protein